MKANSMATGKIKINPDVEKLVKENKMTTEDAFKKVVFSIVDKWSKENA